MIKQSRHFQTLTRPSAQNIYEVVNCQKRAEIRSFHATLLLLYMYAGGAHPNWPLPSFPPREEAEISSVRKSPKATPTSQADAVTHTPVAKSQSRSIYYPPPTPVFQCVSLVLAPSGKPDSSVKIACLARLPPPPLPQQHFARACKCWLAWENFGVKCPQPRGINLGKNTCA